MMKVILVLFCSFFVACSSYAAAKKDDSKPEIIILDFMPFKINHISGGKTVYTVNVTFRIETNTAIEPQIKADKRVLVDGILFELKDYVQARPDHKSIDYAELKDKVVNFLNSKYPNNEITDVLISNIYMK